MSLSPLLAFKNNLLSAGDMSLSSVTSSVQILDNNACYAVQAYWTGSSPVGNISIQASVMGTVFSEIANFSVAGNTGSCLLNVERGGYVYIQAVYTSISGTGSLTIDCSAKLV